MRKYNKEKLETLDRCTLNSIYGKRVTKRLKIIDKICDYLLYIIMLEIGFFIGLILGGILK